MAAAFHSGELNVQASAGVQATARRIGAMIHPTIPPAAQHFLRQQRMVVAGTLDEHGHVWASLLTGQPGFIQALDERTLRIAAHPLAGVHYYRKESFSKFAAPALIEEIRRDNDIVVTAIGD